MDADGDVLTYIIISQTTNGLIVNNNDGTLTYTPDMDFNGQDSFTYMANDGEYDSNEGTVTITVNEVPDAPVVLSIAVPAAAVS